MNASNRVEKKRKIQVAKKPTKITVVNEIYNNNSNTNNNVPPPPAKVSKPMMISSALSDPNNRPVQVFENKNSTNKSKVSAANKNAMKSAIGGLKKMSKTNKKAFESRLNKAFQNQNLNKMTAIRNEAIKKNKDIQNQLAKEKKMKEEAKEAQRKKEAELVAKRKAEREAKKKEVNIVKRQLNAANNILKLANKALTRKAAEEAAEAAKKKLRRNAEKKATRVNKSRYQALINARTFKIPTNKKKVFVSRIQRATTMGQVLKAYNNAQKLLSNK